jgi:hypothetical protein
MHPFSHTLRTNTTEENMPPEHHFLIESVLCGRHVLVRNAQRNCSVPEI